VRKNCDKDIVDLIENHEGKNVFQIMKLLK